MTHIVGLYSGAYAKVYHGESARDSRDEGLL